MTFTKKLLVIGLCSYSSSLFGQAKPVLTHPFQAKLKSFSLIQKSAVDRSNMELRVIAPVELGEAGLNPRFSLRAKHRSGFSLQENSSIESVSYGFNLDSFPVCDSEVKIHRSQSGHTVMIGEMPSAPTESFSASSFPYIDTVQKIVDETFVINALGKVSNIASQERCLLPQDGLVPVWKLVVQTQSGLSYDVVADGNEVYRFDPRFFHIEGRATVYGKNSVQTPNLEPIPLREMDDSGLLANKYFQTCLPAGAGKAVCRPGEIGSAYEFAQSDAREFAYDPQIDSNKFIQASIFAHTNATLEWLEASGYKNFGAAQIKLIPHFVFSSGDINNAVYNPASVSSPPMIMVGDGDNQGLQNLGTDSDVVSHELAHHVVFSSITQTSGESLVLHEGLADFFTFARTGDACLGESICPATSKGDSYCARPRQCLRSGENDLTFGSPDLPNLAHLRGQFVSGMLWDMIHKDQIPVQDMVSMVLKGIDLLVYNSGYKHLVVALMMVDHADFGDRYCNSILERAKVRGLGATLEGITCEAIYSGAGTSILPQAPTAAATVEKKKSKSGCGTLSGSSSGQSSSLLLILSLPIALSLVRRKKS